MFIRGQQVELLEGDAGNGGAAGAASGGAAGSGDAGGGAGNGAGAAGAGGGGGAAAPAWHGLTEQTDIDYLTNKGWQKPSDVIQGYRGAEKLIGRDPNTLLVMPRADDPDGMRAVFSKLGMPESADKYEISKPANGEIDADFAGWAKPVFHKLGLTAAQAKELTAAYNEYGADRMGKLEKDYNDSLANDKQTLADEWRDGHERKMNVAKAAANNLGFKPEVINAIEKAVGYAATMRLFADLGAKMSEDGFVGTTGGKGFGNMPTPAEAKAEFEAMKADPNVAKSLTDKDHPGHKAAVEKQTRLFRIMFPE